MGTVLNVQAAKTGATGVGVIEQTAGTTPLPVLIDRAANALANAKNAAEVLEARDMASIAYDMAKATARLGKAKQAHDELIAAAHRAQADALTIEAQAKRRLADEYDRAQARGEVAKHGGIRGNQHAKVCDENVATAADIGLSRLEIHEARELRDAEAADPGIVRRTVEEAVTAGKGPTKAKVRRAVKKVTARSKSKPKKKAAPKKATAPVPQETQHERDLRVLITLWTVSCDSAREEFQDKLPEMVSLKQRLSELEGELQHIRHNCKCGDAKPAEPPTPSTIPATPNMAALAVGDGLDIPPFLRRKL
jgi:hypothetical protein